MKRLKYPWRTLFRVCSLLLVGLGIFCGYWWFYKLAPSRCTCNPEWISSHSEQEYWREVQKGIRRGMWWHDDGFAVGWYGDKPWAEWIMAHVKPGTSMGCGGQPSHSATAMRYITNQHVGEDTNDWLKWWEANRSKSQVEWIEEGFRQLGYNVDVPPLQEQNLTLLEILGTPDIENGSSFSGAVRYNAFRCLRDSSFEPVAFVISKPELSEEVERGLLAYARMERQWPSVDRLGILPLAESTAELKEHLLPLLLTARFRAMANILVFGPLVLGISMWIYSYRERRGVGVILVLFASTVAGVIAIAAVAIFRPF